MKTVEELHVELETYRTKRDIQKVFACAQELYEVSKQESKLSYQIIACYHLGNGYFDQGEYEKAKELTHEGLRLCEVASFPFYQMVLYNLAGILYGTQGDEVQAVEYTLKSYYIAYDHEELDYIYIILNNLGVMFLNLGYYEIARDYFEKSFQERHIANMSEIRANDGYNLINLLGCCVYLKDAKGYAYWLAWIHAFFAMYEDPTVRNDYRLYQVYLSMDNKEALITAIQEFLAHMMDDPDKLHTFKNLIRIMDICMEKKMKAQAQQLLAGMEEIMKQYPEYQKLSSLKKCQVRYYQTFADEAKLHQALEEYYVVKEAETKRMHANMKQTLQVKIAMEQLLYEQNRIIEKNEELLARMELEEFTQVLNKSAFRRHVEYELVSMHEDQFVCLVVVDIDKFKEINDSYGHLMGDEILLKVTKVLKSFSRTNDLLARIGGDEFCMYMKNNLSKAFIHEKLTQIVQMLHEIQVQDVFVSVSVGVGMSDHRCAYEDLFQLSDEAMYEAKRSGGNRYVIKEL